MGKDEIYETVQNELRCGRINIKGHLNLQRLPWILINQRDKSGHLDRDISLTTGLYTGCFLSS